MSGLNNGECPQCGSDSQVRDSRPGTIGIRRRRFCANAKCGNRWTTYELAIADIGNLRTMRGEFQELVNRLPIVPELTGHAASDLEKAIAAEEAA